MKNLYLDIAAYSDKDLNTHGVYACAEPKHGHVLLLAYVYDNESPKIINLMKGEFIPRELINALGDATINKITYDARFARVFLSGCLFHQPDEFILSNNWYCLKTWAGYLGYPKTFQGVLDVLGIHSPCPNLRALTEHAIFDALDEAGGIPSKAVCNEILPKLNVLAGCMMRSLETTRELYHRLSAMPMNQFEWIHYWVSENVSDHGIRVDVPFLVNATSMTTTINDDQWNKFCELTGLHRCCSVQSFRYWLSRHGVNAASLSQDSLSKLLNETAGEVRLSLQLWRDIMCNPVRKYMALLNHVGTDSRVRGLFFPNGGRLGEFSFPHFQADCVPVCDIENDQEVRKHIIAGDLIWIRANSESPSAVLAHMLSTAFIPSEGMHFAAFNFERLAPSVLRWLAQVNLQSCAACVGETTFQPEPPLAGEYFPSRAYTSDDPAICRLYLDVENAIRDCLTTRCTMYMSMLRFSADSDKLSIQLPSGHVLTYHQPLIRVDTAGFSAIRVMGLNADGKWDFQLLAGKDFVSDIVRAIARDIILFAMISAEAHNDYVCLPYRDGVLLEVRENKSLIQAMGYVKMLPYWADDLNGVITGYLCEDYFKRMPRPTSKKKGGAHDA